MEMVHFIPPGQRRLAMLAAQAEAAPVLIRGGSGTGKGAIARWIHLNGPRAALPLIEADRKSPLAINWTWRFCNFGTLARVLVFISGIPRVFYGVRIRRQASIADLKRGSVDLNL